MAEVKCCPLLKDDCCKYRYVFWNAEQLMCAFEALPSIAINIGAVSNALENVNETLNKANNGIGFTNL